MANTRRLTESDHIFPQGGSGSLESRAKEVISAVKTARGQSEAKFQEGKLSEPAKVRKETGSIYTAHKNSQRNFRFRERKIQSSATNDNPGREAEPRQILRNNGKEQPKAAKKGETFGKDKALAILMV
ncbi:hypothetical protein Tco_0435432 [Tanacetum coccineum]